MERIREVSITGHHLNCDLPVACELSKRPGIQQIIDLVAGEVRTDKVMAMKMSMYLCHRFSGCTLQEIGRHFGVGESAAAENSNGFATVLYQDQLLAEKVAGVLAGLDR